MPYRKRRVASKGMPPSVVLLTVPFSTTTEVETSDGRRFIESKDGKKKEIVSGMSYNPFCADFVRARL